jgi:hypothetical protein
MRYSAKDPQIYKPKEIKGKIKELFCVCHFQNTKQCNCKQLLHWSYSWYSCYVYGFANLRILSWNISWWNCALHNGRCLYLTCPNNYRNVIINNNCKTFVHHVFNYHLYCQLVCQWSLKLILLIGLQWVMVYTY